MRPAGELRQAIGRAARELAAERAVNPSYSVAGGTWRELAARACVGFQPARRTVENMARAGALQPLGLVRVDGARRPMVLYGPAGSAAVAVSLETVMRGWP